MRLAELAVRYKRNGANTAFREYNASNGRETGETYYDRMVSKYGSVPEW